MCPIGSGHTAYQIQWNAFGRWLILFLGCCSVQPGKPSVGHLPHPLHWGPLRPLQSKEHITGRPAMRSRLKALPCREESQLCKTLCKFQGTISYSNARHSVEALTQNKQTNKRHIDWVKSEWTFVFQNPWYFISVYSGGRNQLELWHSANLYLRA